jgi:uncharacterized membrane protein
MTLGPVQILVVGFEGNQFRGEILQELRRLREHDIVRLLDLLVVAKDGQGNVQALRAGDLSQQDAELGASIRTLIGFGGEPGAAPGSFAVDEQEVWDVVEAIPDGSAAAIALLEHRWAIPLDDAIVRAGGTPLADGWVHRDDLAAAGLAE